MVPRHAPALSTRNAEQSRTAGRRERAAELVHLVSDDEVGL